MEAEAATVSSTKQATVYRKLRLEPTGLSTEEIQARAIADLDLPPLREAHEYKTQVPLTMTLFCDDRKISSVLDVFRESDLVDRVPDLPDDDQPIVVIDQRQRKTIYTPSQQPLGTIRRFVAVQYAHIVLHVPSRARGCFLSRTSVPVECAQEAAAFARALLMPASLLAQYLALNKDDPQMREQDVATTFGVPVKMAGRRLRELGDLHLLVDRASASLSPPKSPNRSPPRFER